MTTQEKEQVLDEICHYDVTVTAENLENDLFDIYNRLFEDVKREDVVFKELQGGYVNSIYKVSLKNDENKAIVFRTFGMKFDTKIMDEAIRKAQEAVDQQTAKKNDKEKSSTEKQPASDLNLNEVLFSRITESKVMQIISREGLCKPVYAKYNNGMAYGYTPGVLLNGVLMLTNDFLNEMASKLAKFHSIEYVLPGQKFETHFDRVMKQVGTNFSMILDQIDLEIGDKIKQYPFNQIPPASVLFKDTELINSLLDQLGRGRIGFCHNDCNQFNVIWHPHQRTLGFIDFEMTMNNYCSVELGYLFGCFPGHFLYDFQKELFPNADYRRNFLRKYLEEYNHINKIKQTSEQFEYELEKLFVVTNLTTLDFMLRLSMMGKFFDMRPETFQNERLKKKREETKFYCTTWSLQIYDLYKDLRDEFIEIAQKYLDKQSKVEV